MWIGDGIATTTTNMATNRTNIATNQTNNATNQTNIATKQTDIATNTTNIATNQTDIATNATNIATNTTNITTNTTNIATNISEIAIIITGVEVSFQTALAWILTNDQNDATNGTSVGNNVTKIENNVTNIENNVTSIDALMDRIAVLEGEGDLYKPKVHACGSFASDGTAINGVSFNCTCISATMYDFNTAINPEGFGQRPETSGGFGPYEAGHYKIKFTTRLTHVNYSISIQPQATQHFLNLTSDVISKDQNYFTFRICGQPNSLDEAFSFTVFDYNA